jgi:hypothetical protein
LAARRRPWLQPHHSRKGTLTPSHSSHTPTPAHAANLHSDNPLGAAAASPLAVAGASPPLEGHAHPSAHSSLTPTPAHASRPPLRHPTGHWTLDAGRRSGLTLPRRAHSPLLSHLSHSGSGTRPANLQSHKPLAAGHRPLATGRSSRSTTPRRGHSPLRTLLSHSNPSTGQPTFSSTTQRPPAIGHRPLAVASALPPLKRTLTPPSLQLPHKPANLQFDDPLATGHWSPATGRGPSLTTPGRAHSPLHSHLSPANSSTRQPTSSSTTPGPRAWLQPHPLLEEHTHPSTHSSLTRTPARASQPLARQPTCHRPPATDRASGLTPPRRALSPLHSVLSHAILHREPASLQPGIPPATCDRPLATGHWPLAVDPASPLREGHTHPSTHSSLTPTPAHASRPTSG